MADIDIHCPSCNAVKTVSEFVDASTLKCGKCEAQLVKPPSAGEPKQTPTVKRQAVKMPNRPPIAVATPAGEEKQSSVFPTAPPAGTTAPQPTQKKKFTSLKSNRLEGGYLIGSVATFIVLGLLVGAMRYSNVLSSGAIESIVEYGPYLMIAIHLFIFLYACRDSIFTGLLCLLVPGYGIYYLFFLADSFYARAIIGGLLVGIGFDSVIFFYDLFGRACDWVEYALHHTVTG